jgi:murein DD-endopeptidase MepM/ murein hydrolase activator NlpD
VLRELAVSVCVSAGVLLGGLAAADEAGDAAVTAESASSAPGAAATGPIFPIPGEIRAEPHFAEGRFGAFRSGRKKRRDCGRGHCGIDLCSTIGAPVVAVMDGVIAQIDRSTGGEGGRWVRIQHDDGTATWYMHLARIREGLVIGATVHAGDKIATLGRTGVTTSPTHLHFALTVGAPGRERHLDPTGFLEIAALVSAPFDATPSPSPLVPERPEKVRRSQRPEF